MGCKGGAVGVLGRGARGAKRDLGEAQWLDIGCKWGAHRGKNGVLKWAQMGCFVGVANGVLQGGYIWVTDTLTHAIHHLPDRRFFCNLCQATGLCVA
jgi:hypothetical protein